MCFSAHGEAQVPPLQPVRAPDGNGNAGTEAGRMNPKPFRTPYRRGAIWWARLPVADGSNREVSLGIRDEAQANRALQALASSFNADFWQRDLVHAVGRGHVAIGAFLAAHQSGKLKDLASRVQSPDPDLAGEVDGWQAWLTSRNRTTAGTRAKYRQQLEQLIPPGSTFPASAFTPKRISEFLNRLRIKATNRYRAALSSFGKYLVEREVLSVNPVRSVEGAKEAEPRCRYLERDDAQRLVTLIDSQEARALHALMCGTGLEVGVALRLRHRDIQVEAGQYPSVRAPGTKRMNRNRSIYITEPWCWEIFGAWLHQQPALPGAPVFTIGYDGAAAALKRALDAAEIDDYKPHDWRHTYAVQALRDGLAAQTVAHQLGHKDATMVLKVYGRFVPNRADYERHRLTIGQTVGPRLYVAQTPKAVSR